MGEIAYSKRKRWQGIIMIASMIVLLAILVPLQQDITYHRLQEDLREEIVILPGEFMSNFIISGFRGVAVDILWMRVDEYWHTGQHFKMLPLFRAITLIQSRFIEAWSLGGWQLIYNMSSLAPTRHEADEYIEDGIQFLQEGISKNSRIHDLYFELGWSYYHRLEDYDEAIRYFRMGTRFSHPPHLDRLIAHAYKKKGDLRAAYKEWKRCEAIFVDDEHHQGIVTKQLSDIRKELGIR